jgi:hypothetical protein
MNIADRQKPAPGELFVDHVSHFVADLDAAAAVFESVGMKVTAVSAQKTPEGPVGASNRCVMLEEGYIELLSPTHDTPAAQRMRTLMARYDGIHLLCFGTPDAEAEHRRLQAHGFEPLELVDLRRRVKGGTAKFKVVRLPPDKMPEGRIQYVQQLTPEHLWRREHVNRLRLEEVFVVARDPAQAAARWGRFGALIPARARDGVQLETARGRITIAQEFPGAPPPAIAGYALRTRDPKAFAKRCAKAGLQVKGSTVKLPPALGGFWRLR